MPETLAALFFAHVLADYVLQTRWMVETKESVGTISLHGALVLLTAMAATGQWARWEILALAGAHIVIDIAKSKSGDRRRLAAYIADQSAHLATVLVAAALAPDLWQTGYWAAGPFGDASDWLPRAMLLLAGAIYVTRAGGFAVEMLMAPYSKAALTDGLPDGGRLIGHLERGLIFVMILAGLPAAIGFLIAAKSVMRFETASKEQKAAEYVIIGTLASFAWAIAVTLAVVVLLDMLPPLEIDDVRP